MPDPSDLAVPSPQARRGKLRAYVPYVDGPYTSGFLRAFAAILIPEAKIVVGWTTPCEQGDWGA